MQTNGSLVLTDGLHVLDGDELAVDVEAELAELVGDHHAVHAAIDGALRAHLGGDGQSHTSQTVGYGLSVVLNLLELLGLLLQLFSEHLLGTLGSDNTLTGRNKIIAAIARLHIYDVVLVTQADHIFFQNDFHSAYSSF